ncbi:uncharacterized protein LOC122504016 [Leptopilina heterotoma]|uniref:uncharacterized protein LOC122504016 n=1 Tax=Leptopilina heterotoma TaxID=63436 RepID=UPI001CAA0FA3|nr:uncharacterized protein LOC122504016 [Leptopilina heterotoma]
MSKFVFLLCAILLTGAVYAEEKDEEEKNVNAGIVGTIKNEVVGVVDLAIYQIKNYGHDVMETTLDAIKTLNDEALNITKTVVYRIAEAQQNIRAEVNEALKEVIGQNVTECEQIVDTFDQTATAAQAEVSQCMDKVLESANGYSQKMRHSIEVIVQNLTVIKDEAIDCVQDISTVRSSTRALVCIQKTAVKGTLATTTNVPKFWANFGRLAFRVSTLGPELSFCSTVNGVKKVNAGSQTVVQQVRECIKKKL